MKIDLLLQHVSQDQRAPTGESEFLGWMHGPSSGGNGGDNKKKRKHKEKHHPDRPHEDKPRENDPKPASKSNAYQDLILRPERWGGVLINDESKRVYAADAEAFALLLRLKDGETFDDIRSTADDGRSKADEIESLLTTLEMFR